MMNECDLTHKTVTQMISRRNESSREEVVIYTFFFLLFHGNPSQIEKNNNKI